MAKKHEHTRTANGYTYKSYRKQATYRGQAFRAEAQSKADWEARFEEFKLAVDSDLMGSDPNMRVYELAELFNEDARSLAKPKTIQERRRILDVFIIPTIGHVKLREVGHEHVAKVYGKAKLVSAPTLNAVHRVTHRMFNFAIENMMVITKNPVSKGLVKQVHGFSASAKNTENPYEFFLGTEEADLLLMHEKCQGQPAEIVFHLMLFHGLRYGEALAMRWDDVDLDERAITVNWTVSDASKSQMVGTQYETKVGPIITAPKTKKSRRTVPLMPPTMAILERTPTDERQGLIYANKAGNAYHPSNFRNRVFNPIRQDVGLVRVTIYDMRKYFGSVLIGRGVNIALVSKLMGHASPEITWQRYIKVIPDANRQAREQIELAFSMG